MKQKCITGAWMMILMVSLFASCTRKDVPLPVTQGPINNPNTPQQGGGQEQTLKIKVQAVIKIGDIIYDSIPASFTLTSYDNSMQPHMLMLRLKPGVNEISVPANHVRYRLQVKEWNQTDEMTLDRNNIQEDIIYTLGGGRTAKKLKYEINAVLVNGVYRADSKTEYQYDARERLVKILLFRKRPTGDIYVAVSEDLYYENEKVAYAIKKDGAGNEISKLFIDYDQQGKIISLKQQSAGEETTGMVTYTIKTEGVETHLKHVSGKGATDYYMLLNRGNQVKRSSVAYNNINEWSSYGYDTNINPYIHMKWPDIFMSRNSKNNVSWTGKEYYAGNLTLDPVSYNYSYDAEGYPVSLVKESRSAQTGSVLATTKTTYHY